MLRIGVIVRPKKTDALICRSLAHYFHLEIAQYGVPYTGWLSWISKRIRNAGLLALVGHLGLSFVIKCEQVIERLGGRTLWQRHGTRTPEWGSLNKTICRDEQSLKQRLKDVDVIVAADAFRLSQSFFRGLHAPYLEIVWGDATKYLGDSSAFWEYAMGNQDFSMVSIIQRTGSFQTISVVFQIPVVAITAHEGLRTLKVKQAIELSRQLPVLLKDVPSRLNAIQTTEERRMTIRQCYAPTLWTYIAYRLRGLRVLPKYACRPKEIMVKMIQKY